MESRAMENRTDWFNKCKWGVFTHYLAEVIGEEGGTKLSADQWNRHVDAFDVLRLVDQLVSLEARYYFITIGQNSGHYCSPNATYDELVGIRPSKCSRRDLVADLSEGLARAGIALLVYLPSGAPEHDPVAAARLEWEAGTPEPWTLPQGQARSKRLAGFQRKWEAIIREWSLRWGGKVRGWWIDGCYYADDMYRSAEEPNFHSFAAALRAGNPQAIVAFNNGQSDAVIRSDEDDYTAGEISHWFPICYRRWVEKGGHKAQFHAFSFLGQTWGRGELRFPDEFVAGYTRQVTGNEGVVTWEVPITESGFIPRSYFEQLKCVGNAIRQV